MRMKYVIFKFNVNGINLIQPIIFPEHVVHSMIKHEDNQGGFLEPYSAGFFRLEKGKLIIESGISESLNLGPGDNDKIWLERSIAGCNCSFFLADENNQPII